MTEHGTHLTLDGLSRRRLIFLPISRNPLLTISGMLSALAFESITGPEAHSVYYRDHTEREAHPPSGEAISRRRRYVCECGKGGGSSEDRRVYSHTRGVAAWQSTRTLVALASIISC